MNTNISFGVVILVFGLAILISGLIVIYHFFFKFETAVESHEGGRTQLIHNVGLMNQRSSGIIIGGCL